MSRRPELVERPDGSVYAMAQYHGARRTVAYAVPTTGGGWLVRRTGSHIGHTVADRAAALAKLASMAGTP